jgi:hypothetical protein
VFFSRLIIPAERGRFLWSSIQTGFNFLWSSFNPNTKQGLDCTTTNLLHRLQWEPPSISDSYKFPLKFLQSKQASISFKVPSIQTGFFVSLSQIIMGDYTFLFLWISYSHPNTYLNSFPVWMDPMFCICIPVKFLCFSYPYAFAILCSKGALIYIPNNKKAKFQVFFLSIHFVVRLPLTTNQLRVCSARTYINPC